MFTLYFTAKLFGSTPRCYTALWTAIRLGARHDYDWLRDALQTAQ